MATRPANRRKAQTMGRASEQYLKLHKRLRDVDGMTSHEATKWLVEHAPEEYRDYIEEYNEQHNQAWERERQRIDNAAAHQRKQRGL